MKFREYLSTLKTYIHNHKQSVKIAGLVVASIALLALLVSLYAYNTESKKVKIVYNPVLACNLLTEQEAKELLGEKVINRNEDANKAVVGGNRATSNCSYTDMSVASMRVAAVAVRSGLNDEGVAENKQDFASKKQANTVEVIDGIGDSAYYVPANGQLNVLDGTSWILISTGVGDNVATYTKEDAVILAKKVITTKKS